MPSVLNLFLQFGLISGYKFNLRKSELMPVLEYPLQTLLFKASQHNFKYLGICVTHNFSDLFDNNSPD